MITPVCPNEDDINDTFIIKSYTNSGGASGNYTISFTIHCDDGHDFYSGGGLLHIMILFN